MQPHKTCPASLTGTAGPPEHDILLIFDSSLPRGQGGVVHFLSDMALSSPYLPFCIPRVTARRASKRQAAV